MIRPIILAGGIGSRLWPISSDDMPKQFISINNELSLFQKTVLRFKAKTYLNPFIVTNSKFYAIVEEQLAEIDGSSDLVLLEQLQRNTCPAILISLLQINDDEDVLIVPSDHLFDDEEIFNKNINNAIKYIENNISIFGIKPTKAHTGYGYLHVKEPKNGSIVSKFVEKPNISMAKKYIQSGEYFWNSGLILAKKSVLFDQILKHCPEIVEYCVNAHKLLKKTVNKRLIDAEAMIECPSISIDYGVLEKTTNIVFVEIKTQWNDLGAWDSYFNELPKDSDNNFISGNVINVKSKNSLIISTDKIVSAIGVTDSVIVDTPNGTLVSDIKSSQDVKLLKDIINKIDPNKNIIGHSNHRPWGSYITIYKGENFQLKLITVDSGHKLSVQKHFKRAEHWIVVKGRASVQIDKKVFNLTTNEHCFIPKESIHSLENPNKDILQIIELQYGEYLGEDDIVRFEDRYGRLKD